MQYFKYLDVLCARGSYVMYKINSGVGSKFESGGQDLSEIMKSNKKGSFVMVMHNFAKLPHL